MRDRHRWAVARPLVGFGLVTAFLLPVAGVSFPSAASADVSCHPGHCYSILYQDTHQYGGLQYDENEAYINPQLSGFHVSSEAWFASHCFVNNAYWVETGISEDNTGYFAFYDYGEDGAPGFVTPMAYLSNGSGTGVTFTILTEGNGKFYVDLDATYFETPNIGLVDGSCLQEGGEVLSSDAYTGLFGLYGNAYSDSLNLEHWGTPQYASITSGSGLGGATYGSGVWQWDAP